MQLAKAEKNLASLDKLLSKDNPSSPASDNPLARSRKGKVPLKKGELDNSVKRKIPPGNAETSPSSLKRLRRGSTAAAKVDDGSAPLLEIENLALIQIDSRDNLEEHVSETEPAASEVVYENDIFEEEEEEEEQSTTSQGDSVLARYSIVLELSTSQLMT